MSRRKKSQKGCLEKCPEPEAVTFEPGSVMVLEDFNLELIPSQGAFVVVRAGVSGEFRLPLERIVLFFMDIGVRFDDIKLIERKEKDASEGEKILLWNLMNVLRQKRL